MNIKAFNDGNLIFDGEVKATESDFTKKVGELLLKCKIPSTLDVMDDNGHAAEYAVGTRGKYVDEDGNERPSMFVTEKRYDFDYCLDTDCNYPEKYLVCIHFASNNYKYYHMIPAKALGTFEVEYGRCQTPAGEMFGKKKVQTPYPMRLFWIRYYEKLSKGYKDYSEAYLKESKKKNVKKDKNVSFENEASKRLYEALISCSRHYAAENITSGDEITDAQYKAALKYFKDLQTKKTVKAFNRALSNLMAVLPRKERDIRGLCAETNGDFSRIINREEVFVNSAHAVSETNEVGNAFKENGIYVFAATDEQKEKVMNMIEPSQRYAVKNIYRVVCDEQKKRFNSYLKETGIKKVKEVFHGSRNENWFSIILNSLSLNPDAVITGRMFGNGLYFAKDLAKSKGYTSTYGSRWAHGNTNTGYIGVFAIAYGKPYNLNDACSSMTKARIKSLGYDSVHAHAGSSLRMDEIIVYDERAVCLNYIIELAV